MTLSVNTEHTGSINTAIVHEIKIANLVKGQTELEGQMALQLIQSANINTQLAAPVGNIGHSVNIKA
ncbi:MAG: hypothetical protein ACPG46_05285 [Thalassotalea sp.]